VLIVMAILGLVATLAALDLAPWTEQLALRGRASDVARVLAAARNEAMAHQTVVLLGHETVGLAAGGPGARDSSHVIRHGGRTARFEGRLHLQPAAEAAAMRPVFFPDGSTNIAEIAIEGRKRSLKLDGYGRAHNP